MPVQPKYFQLPMTPASPTATERPAPVRPSRKPLLRLQFNDLSSEGAKSFLTLLDCANVLEYAVDTVLSTLYNVNSNIPPTRSITLILRSMGGVAYTTGKDIDSDHKEIHFSTDYISKIPKERRKDEMLGVLVHEMVHCWQWAAKGSCPGGLIEGIADFVRLKAGHVPPHWKREAGGDWDAGYQHTGYFLNWLEQTMGAGTVRGINERLREREYKEGEFWNYCCGEEVKELWKRYGKSLKKDEDGKAEVQKDEAENGKEEDKNAAQGEAEQTGEVKCSKQLRNQTEGPQSTLTTRTDQKSYADAAV